MFVRDKDKLPNIGAFKLIKSLISNLLTLENPYHCPHGRPTMISFSRDDLDKMFKRIV